MNNYEKVADWIIEECDTPHREVAWLLEKLYENKKPKLTFEEAYGDVLKMLKESGGGVMDSNQRKADLLYNFGGQGLVYDKVNEGLLKCDKWEYCGCCECQSPIYKDSCLVCEATIESEVE